MWPARHPLPSNAVEDTAVSPVLELRFNYLANWLSHLPWGEVHLPQAAKQHEPALDWNECRKDTEAEKQ